MSLSGPSPFMPRSLSSRLRALKLDFHIYTCSEIQLHERIYGLRGRINNIEKALMSAHLELLAALLVDVRRRRRRRRCGRLRGWRSAGLFHRDRRDQLDVNDTLSPGITISVPSGSVTVPVTSVVRK
jgi:hypothetical protein